MGHPAALFADDELKRYDKRTSNDIPLKWRYAARDMGCGACPLSRSAGKLKPLHVEGGGPRVYVIGRSPTGDEHAGGVQFSSEWGRKIMAAFARHDMNVMYDTVVRCAPLKYTGTPNKMEIACCDQYISASMDEFDPDAVVIMGKENLTKMFGAIGGINAWRGRRLIFRLGNGKNVYCYPVFHPSEMKSEYFQDMFYRDLDRACTSISRQEFVPGDVPDPSRDGQNIRILESLEQVRELLRSRRDEPIVSFDIETTNLISDNKDRSLRPYAPGSILLSIGLAWNDTNGESFVFPVQHPDKDKAYQEAVMDELHSWFMNSPTLKVAHNLAYELEWLAWLFRGRDGSLLRDGGPWGDTMAQSFVLDSRPGGLSLDSRTLELFGFRLKELNKHLSMDSLEKEDMHQVLRYNAMDAYWTLQTWFVQTAWLTARDFQDDVYYEQVARIAPMVGMQLKGIRIDQDRLREVNDHFQSEIKDAVDHFEARQVNPGSPKALLEFLQENVSQDILTTGEVALRKHAKNEDVAQLLKYRKYSKLLSTYTGPLMSCVWEDGKVHTNYRTMRMVTRRVSSDQPNMQNIPKHKGAESKMLRSVFVAPSGYKMVSVDYGQIEARVLAMASEDAFFHSALRNHYDIHQEWAQRLKEVFPQFKDVDDRDFRQITKNFFVFPNFYGAGSKNIAENMGIRNVSRVSDVRNEFWQRFDGVRKWQNRMIGFYRDNGYVESLSFYRRYGPLSYTEVINTPIQSSASDIVVRSQTNLVNLAYETGNPDLVPIMNIHDDLTFYVREDALDLTIKTIVDTMLSPGLDWITTPLVAEASVGDRWDQMEDYGTYEA